MPRWPSAAAASEITGIAPRLGKLAGWGAALFGPPLASYTAVLVSNTAIPAWHEARNELPVLFVSSAAAAGAGAGLFLAAAPENGPVVRLGAVAAGVELAAGKALEKRLDRLPGGVGDAYRTGKTGRWDRAAHALTALGGLGVLLTRRSRAGSALAGLALTAGSLATRFAVFEAGIQSAAEPQHVIAPQRGRLARGERAHSEGSGLETERSTPPVPRS